MEKFRLQSPLEGCATPRPQHQRSTIAPCHELSPIWSRLAIASTATRAGTMNLKCGSARDRPWRGGGAVIAVFIRITRYSIQSVALDVSIQNVTIVRPAQVEVSR